MKKHIKKIGTQVGITFTKPELKVYGWKEGDVLDLAAVTIVKSKVVEQ